MPSGTNGWSESVGQLFSMSGGDDARDKTARPAVEKIVSMCAQSFNDGMEKLGATMMDGEAGAWIKASVISDQQSVVYR